MSKIAKFADADLHADRDALADGVSVAVNVAVGGTGVEVNVAAAIVAGAGVGGSLVLVASGVAVITSRAIASPVAVIKTSGERTIPYRSSGPRLR